MAPHSSRAHSTLRALTAFLASIALVVIGVAVPSAADPEAATGSISGTVTREDTGEPVEGATVHFSSWDEDGNWDNSYSATTQADGTYRVEGVVADEYWTRFDADDTTGHQDLAPQYWNAATSRTDSTMVQVTPGAEVTGIDAALQKYGSISGTVTRASDGEPLGGVRIRLGDRDGASRGTVTGTGDDWWSSEPGSFEISVAPGRYVIVFEVDPELGLSPEYWDDVTDFDARTEIVVGSGESVTGIDASLEPTGSISGTVTRADTGEPLAGVSIRASSTSRFDPDFFDYENVSAVTDSEGRYLLEGLPRGAHSIGFTNDVPDLMAYGSIARQAVAAGSTTTGADFEFETAPVVQGFVTRADTGAPVPGATVWACTPEGYPEDMSDFIDGALCWGGGPTQAKTQDDGSYLLRLRGTGSFLVEFTAPSGSGLVSEYWDDVTELRSSTLLKLVPGGQPTRADAELAVQVTPNPTPSATPTPSTTPTPEPTGTPGSPRFGPGAGAFDPDVPGQSGSSATVFRFASGDRVQTALDAARSTCCWGDVAILASSTDYSDALTAAPLAKNLRAPILLANSDGSLDPQVKAYLTENVTGVVIVSGPGVIPDVTKNELDAALRQASGAWYAGINTIRVAGADRYETAGALAVASLLSGTGGADAINPLLADGRNFPDALAAGPAAANRSQGVVLLTAGPDGLPSITAQLLAGQSPSFSSKAISWLPKKLPGGVNVNWSDVRSFDARSITVVGGAAQQSAEKGVLGGTSGPIRYDRALVGTDRYATAALVARSYFDASVTHYTIASGQAFPDAIVAGGWAANVGGPLLLTRKDAVPATTVEYLAGVVDRSDKLVVFGGTGTVSPTVSRELAAVGG